jgi:hypothetical protein
MLNLLNDKAVCNKCQTDLVCPDNWRPSRAARNNRICTPCRRTYEVKRLNAKPELREQARAVSRNYRETKPQEARAAVDRWFAANPNYMKNWRLNKKKQREQSQNG